ncbi:hypothetical protein IE077_003146 [Cardiosporidium cionae]|uniref:Uncharacterized protein n=1 Tax=Cardiosporidium cionae TaxID=476202 RepID=A0ABQ7JF75_9APIC|nr:hypothetical protein IE077_003146 [Cardiosporidium cionae]|eukprot:KAF8822677.1 hypothetical protein IE077_003146 [Cardiosporidium cionae]
MLTPPLPLWSNIIAKSIFSVNHTVKQANMLAPSYFNETEIPRLCCLLEQQRNVYRSAGWKWNACQRFRRRWVHIDFPPKDRSTIVKLEGSKEKLMFVCNGYVSQLDKSKLSKINQKRLVNLKRSPTAVNDRRLPDKDVKGALTRQYTPCLAFSRGSSHHLIETLTMKEILEIEKLAPNIREAFESMEKQKEDDELLDANAGHKSLR